MSAVLRAGVIGLGMMGRNHVRVLQDLEGVDLVAVADAYGDRFGVASSVPLCRSLDELLGHRLDICVVAVPTEDHEPVGLQLAEAGVHTLIEKPLANDTAGATKLVDAFEEAGLVGCVGHIERYNPALQSLRRRLEAGELGEIFQIATRRQGPFPSRVRDVGVIKDLATHDFDLTAWVAESRYTAIAARTTHRVGRPHEDMVTAVGALGGDIVTNHLVNWLTPFKERVTIVTGDRGCFTADTLLADLTFHQNGDVATQWDTISRFRGVTEGDMHRFAIPKPEPLRVELENFREAVLGRAAETVTMREGLAVVGVAEAALRSAARGTVEVF